MIWAAISRYSAGHTITLDGRITANDYVDILGNQVHTTYQMLLHTNHAIFQDDNSPIHTARSVRSWFEEHEDAFQHPPWPGQSPALNIIEPLQSVLAKSVKSNFLLNHLSSN